MLPLCNGPAAGLHSRPTRSLPQRLCQPFPPVNAYDRIKLPSHATVHRRGPQPCAAGASGEGAGSGADARWGNNKRASQSSMAEQLQSQLGWPAPAAQRVCNYKANREYVDRNPQKVR